MQELNARVDIDKDTPEQAALAYLKQYKLVLLASCRRPRPGSAPAADRDVARARLGDDPVHGAIVAQHAVELDVARVGRGVDSVLALGDGDARRRPRR